MRIVDIVISTIVYCIIAASANLVAVSNEKVYTAVMFLIPPVVMEWLVLFQIRSGSEPWTNPTQGFCEISIRLLLAANFNFVVGLVFLQLDRPLLANSTLLGAVVFAMLGLFNGLIIASLNSSGIMKSIRSLFQ